MISKIKETSPELRKSTLKLILEIQFDIEINYIQNLEKFDNSKLILYFCKKNNINEEKWKTGNNSK